MPKGASIEISGLSVCYEDGKPVIGNLNLHIDSGENVIIAGPNGCGKTTLLRCMMGLVRPASGRLEIKGAPKGTIAYCGQEKSQSEFPISVEEVLKLGIPSDCRGEDAKKRVFFALEKTGCTHLIKRNFFSLSGGEKQRVSIARCLCQDPTLLLLDEPTTYLDNASRDALYGILGSLASTELTVIMASHEAEIFSHFSEWRLEKLPDIGKSEVL